MPLGSPTHSSSIPPPSASTTRQLWWRGAAGRSCAGRRWRQVCGTAVTLRCAVEGGGEWCGQAVCAALCCQCCARCCKCLVCWVCAALYDAKSLLDSAELFSATLYLRTCPAALPPSSAQPAQLHATSSIHRDVSRLKLYCHHGCSTTFSWAATAAPAPMPLWPTTAAAATSSIPTAS
jgi:hypothetical protein